VRLSMKKSFEQFARTKRWLIRLDDSSLEEKMDKEDPKYFEDILYEVFENCWHLKDWVKKSGEFDKKSVDDFFHQNVNMRLCQALANVSKHLKTDPHIEKIRIVRRTKPGRTNLKILTVFSERGKGFDAVGLARACVKECGDFLVKNKIVR